LVHSSPIVPAHVPSPHAALQSLSLACVHPDGQHISPFVHVVIAGYEHAALHIAALPISTLLVHAIMSLHIVGQLDGGSHFSGAVTTPSPHVALQSLSLPIVHPGAQQPSPPAHAVIGDVAHAALQFAALPVTKSVVHAMPSLHVVGHDDGGSQVSPICSTLSPQLAEQSPSVAVVQPAGQHMSAAPHVVIAMRSQRRSHVESEPVALSAVQSLPSSQLSHASGGSQVSLSSTIPLPHVVPAASPFASSNIAALRSPHATTSTSAMALCNLTNAMVPPARAGHGNNR
jgi:hypothetical protein